MGGVRKEPFFGSSSTQPSGNPNPELVPVHGALSSADLSPRSVNVVSAVNDVTQQTTEVPSNSSRRNMWHYRRGNIKKPPGYKNNHKSRKILLKFLQTLHFLEESHKFVRESQFLQDWYIAPLHFLQDS